MRPDPLAVGVAGLLVLWLLAAPASGQRGPDDPLPPDVKRQILDLRYPVIDLQSGQSALAGTVQDLVMRETPTEIRIDVAADVLFDFDKAVIKPQAQQALTQVATVIKDKARGTVRIEGHTDGKGADSYNMRLSNQRADAVKTWLVGKGGLTTFTFETQGLGAKQPVAPNTKTDGSDDPEGRQKNRRVSVVVRKR